MSKLVADFKETVAISGAGTFLSQPMNTVAIDNIGYAIRASAGPTGTTAPTVLYSNDYDPKVDALTDLTKWDTYTLSTALPALTASAQSMGAVLDWYEYKWVRLKFVVDSGAGSIFVAYRGKGI